ncbi:MAG: cysteine desulfurase NifS [Dehalococcoidales bacterium]|nr:cysteine desulfurase NifS [Dehalococcoidales bacterium]
MKRIYLDYAATTPTHPEVVKAMLPYFTESFGNPSSIHACGREAQTAIEQARTKVADLINARHDEIVFTGGGSEADNFALEGVAFANESKGNHIITSAIEHHAVIETCRFLEKRGFNITYLPVDGYGRVDPDDVQGAITNQTILVSVMHANNEIGTIEPIREISRITKEAGVLFHTDAVQTAGHLPINVTELGVDLLSMSAHKLYGPKGVGALYIRKGIRLIPLIHGGEQERGRRASTENVTGIVGFGRAAGIAREEMAGEAQRLTALRDKLIHGLQEQIGSLHLNGHPVNRLPNNVNVSFAFIEGESICLTLDQENICSSTGSACSSASQEPSHVLLAIGLSPELARGSLRLTLGKWTTEEEISHVLKGLPRIITKLRAISPLSTREE